MDLEHGFASSTVRKMRKALDALELWLVTIVGLSLEAALSTNEAAELSLRGFGLHLYAEGHPRYLLVYAITAIQNRCPSYRNRLSAAWQIDKKWQALEPGECRPVLPAAAIRAALCLAALWGWLSWSGLVLIGFLAMLHPSEMVMLIRRDLVFPSDAMGHTQALYVHLRKPKTARFARRQHGKIDDTTAITNASFQLHLTLFGACGMPPCTFWASLAVLLKEVLLPECCVVLELHIFTRRRRIFNFWLGEEGGPDPKLWSTTCKK